MTDMMVNVWRCPCCGKQVLTSEELEDGTIVCDVCDAVMQFAGHQDITVKD